MAALQRVLLILLILRSEISASCALNEKSFEKSERSFKNRQLKELLKHTIQARNYESIFLITAHTFKCAFEEVAFELELPVLKINSEHLRDYEHQWQFSSKVLILSCALEVPSWRETQNTKLLRQLHNAHQVVLLGSWSQAKLEQLCAECLRLDVYNLVIAANADSAHEFYVCRRLAASKKPLLKPIQMQRAQIMFEHQFSNMHGAEVTIMPDLIMPHSMSHGGKLLGYLGKLITTFAERLNATLNVLAVMEDPRLQVADAVINNTCDIGVSAFTYLLAGIGRFSYAFDMNGYCLMVALPPHLDKKQIFFRIVGWSSMILIVLLIPLYGLVLDKSLRKRATQSKWAQLLLHDKSLRAMLGQPFPFPKISNSWTSCFICLQLCYAGLVINTSYQAFLQSWLTKRPLEQPVRSFEDLAHANVKILLSPTKMSHMIAETVRPADRHLIKFASSFKEFDRIGQQLDTRYAYVVTFNRWAAIDQQQNYFERKLFFFSRAHCLLDESPLRLPIREHLPYRDLLDSFILRVHEVGLYRLWFSENFYDMVRVKQAHFKDYSKARNFFKSITLDDLSLVFSSMAVSLMFAIFVFSCEMLKKKPIKLSFKRNCLRLKCLAK